MFTVESEVAKAPSAVALGEVLCASKCIPPNAVVPLMALVTAIRGLCKACVTPRTTCTPIMFDKANVVNMALKAGFGATHPVARIDVAK